MPERWRTGPGTLKERWLSLGYDVRWTDRWRSYEIRPAKAVVWTAEELASSGFLLFATMGTVDDVERWIGGHPEDPGAGR